MLVLVLEGSVACVWCFVRCAISAIVWQGSRGTDRVGLDASGWGGAAVRWPVLSDCAFAHAQLLPDPSPCLPACMVLVSFFRFFVTTLKP